MQASATDSVLDPESSHRLMASSEKQQGSKAKLFHVQPQQLQWGAQARDVKMVSSKTVAEGD